MRETMNNDLRLSFHYILRLTFRLVILLTILASLLFIPAGRIDWVEAWIFIGVYGFFLMLYGVWGLWKDPSQFKERSQVAPNTKSWDLIILAIYTAFLIVLFIVIGLDAGRSRWSHVPILVEGLGWLGQVLAGAIIFWAVVTNTYLSRVARIQEDRGQEVIVTGPYRYIRHPMYIGIIILFLSIPIALGSWWGLIPGISIAILFVIRTAKEDKMLHNELMGYKNYANRVRYRILPGIW